MTKRAKGKRKNVARLQSFYPLSEVRDLIDQEKVDIRSNALEDAQRDFGWGTSDILHALKRLQPSHFHKSDESDKKYRTVMDFYKAHGLKGEDVYTHFYIDDDRKVLVVSSFKKI